MLKQYNPCTPGLRGKVSIYDPNLWKGGPLKKLTSRIASSGGRNNQGRITCRHRMSNIRQIYREICFDRTKLKGIECKVVRLEYDPNRTAYIALLEFLKEGNQENCYIVAPDNLKIGNILLTSDKMSDHAIGNAMQIGNIKDGTFVNCVELKIGKGAALARSAGCFAQVMGKNEKGNVLVKLSSGEIKIIHAKCYATIGVVSNLDHFNEKLGKAGANFWRGRRPSVRGIAMNASCHPNGGRANGGMHFMSPTGIIENGKKTRRNKRTLNTIAKRRGKK